MKEKLPRLNGFGSFLSKTDKIYHPLLAAKRLVHIVSEHFSGSAAGDLYDGRYLFLTRVLIFLYGLKYSSV